MHAGTTASGTHIRHDPLCTSNPPASTRFRLSSLGAWDSRPSNSSSLSPKLPSSTRPLRLGSTGALGADGTMYTNGFGGAKGTAAAGSSCCAGCWQGGGGRPRRTVLMLVRLSSSRPAGRCARLKAAHSRLLVRLSLPPA